MLDLVELASILAISVSLVHSVLGELLIFRRLRVDLARRAQLSKVLSSRQFGIIWASWHIVSIFGICFAAILVFGLEGANAKAVILQIVALGMLLASALVFYATQARHPGWLGLLAIALCCLLAKQAS